MKPQPPCTELGDNKCSGDSKRIELKIIVSCDSFTHTELLQPISGFPRLYTLSYLEAKSSSTVLATENRYIVFIIILFPQTQAEHNRNEKSSTKVSFPSTDNILSLC